MASKTKQETRLAVILITGGIDRCHFTTKVNEADPEAAVLRATAVAADLSAKHGGVATRIDTFVHTV